MCIHQEFGSSLTEWSDSRFKKLDGYRHLKSDLNRGFVLKMTPQIVGKLVLSVGKRPTFHKHAVL